MHFTVKLGLGAELRTGLSVRPELNQAAISMYVLLLASLPGEEG